jgi:hypothetical protein
VHLSVQGLFDELIFKVNGNSKVQYKMQWNNEKKVIHRANLAKIIR